MRYLKEPTDNHVAFYEEFIALSPVTPQTKTGHWISKHIVDDCNGVVTWYECSECGRCVDETITEESMLKNYPYCHCGAKMESEEKE